MSKYARVGVLAALLEGGSGIRSCRLEWKTVWHSPRDDGMVDVEEEDRLADTCREGGIRLEDAYGLVRSEV
jgi:hypothetical protein